MIRANALSGCVDNRMSQERHAFQGLFDPAFSVFVFLAPKCVCFQALFWARLTSLCELRRTCDIVAVAIASVCKSLTHCVFFLLSASNS